MTKQAEDPIERIRRARHEISSPPSAGPGLLRQLVSWTFGAAVLLGSAAALGDEGAAIARGDSAWERRAEGHREDRAAGGPIGEAVTAYEEALKADPGGLEASWRLLRAIYFQGDYAAGSSEEKAKLYDRGKAACGAAVARLGREVPGFEGVEEVEAKRLRELLGGRPDAAKLFFWCAVDWGLWGQNHGKLAAARAGVASQVRDFTLATVALDPRYEGGGGHRVLGRLHSEAPKLPFVTGWVSRETAFTELRRAVAIAPEHPINRIFLAEALLDHGDAARREEAWAILRELAALEPRPDQLVEDLRVRRLARGHLERKGG